MSWHPRDQRFSRKQVEEIERNVSPALNKELAAFARAWLEPNVVRPEGMKGHWIWTRKSFLVEWRGKTYDVRRAAMMILTQHFLLPEADVVAGCKEPKCIRHLVLK